MQLRARMLPVFALLLLCAGAVSGAASSPARRLLGNQLQYIPSGCPLTISVAAEESQSWWFQDAPEIRGRVTLSNPTQYNVPITNIVVQARSSDGMLYSTTAYCDSGSSVTVPYNPQPYQYGSASCRYRIVLDRRVFGSYGGGGSRRLLDAGAGAVKANFFPGSSSGGNSGNGYGYFPAPSSRPTWTVTAIATIRFSNAQCLSAPTPVSTDSWWSWLVSWHQRHGHKGWWFSGRRLMAAQLPTQQPQALAQQPQQDGSVSGVSRSLLGASSFVHTGRGGAYVGSDLDEGGTSVSSLNIAADSVDAAVEAVSSTADRAK